MVLFFIILYVLWTINIAFATKHLGIDFLIISFTQSSTAVSSWVPYPFTRYNLFVGVVELALYAGVILAVVWVPHFIVLFLATIIAVFIIPGFIHLLIQFNCFPAIQKYIIDPYYEAHPGEDISLRRSLALDTEELPEEKPEPIFHDENSL